MRLVKMRSGHEGIWKSLSVFPSIYVGVARFSLFFLKKNRKNFIIAHIHVLAGD